MMAPSRLGLLGVTLLCVAGCGAQPVDEVAPGLFDALPTYAADIRPILRDRCVDCHDSNGARLGGVELDRYASAYSNRVRNACVSLTPELIEVFAGALLPEPTDPPTPLSPCGDWKPYSMPVGAKSHLTAVQQVILGRWVEIGAPP